MKVVTKTFIPVIIFFTIACITTTCKNDRKVSVNRIQQMMDSVERSLLQGPKEWLNYFEDTHSFYMISDGKLVFPDYNIAAKFINDTLVNIINTINLKWSNISVDVLNDNTALARAAFNEDIKFKQGNVVNYDGYFTAVIDNTSSGFKFRNLHWSIAK